jgi:hypothetical protein
MKEFLIDALASEFGIIVKSLDPIALRAKLYPLRKDDAEFMQLGFVISPTNPDEDLWIIKKVRHAEGD